MHRCQRKKTLFAFTLVSMSICVPLLTTAQLGPIPISEGIVPPSCQGSVCNLCQLYELGQRLVRFMLFNIAVPLAAVALGTLLVTAGGSEERQTMGRKALTSTVVGLFIAFAAWIVINTLLLVIGFKVPWGSAITNWNETPPGCGGGASVQEEPFFT